MTTFPEKIKLEEVVPYLNLPSHRNGNVTLWDFKQIKNLVMFFFHGTSCTHCQTKLEELSDVYKSARELEAEIIAVSSDSLKELKRYAKRTKTRFHLLSDRTGETTERFTYKDANRNAPLPSIFITDRFGALRYQKIASEAHELPDAKEVLSWLLLIQTECPECSHL